MSVIPAGAAAIARKQPERPVPIMDPGLFLPMGILIALVIPAGAAAIVPNVAGMDIGINRGITVPAGVPVISAGAAAIVRRRTKHHHHL